MKKRFLGLLATLLLAGMATACDAKEETKTVEWYLQPENTAALEAKRKECKDNPGELANTPNCQNSKAAKQAQFKGGTFEKVKEPTYGF